MRARDTDKRIWLIVTIAWLIACIVVVGILWWTAPDRDPALLIGFRGNLISGLFVGVLFLFFGLYINGKLEKLQIETHALTVERAERDEQQRKIDQFMAFLRTEQYHDARFPNLKTTTEPLGLEYTIEPVRDEAGEPRRHVTEMQVSYVVRVRGVAQEEIRTSEDLAEYESAPIHTGEFYFCQFFNGEWHMARDVIGFDEWHAFYLSGKVGPVEHGMSANEFVGATGAPANARMICRFLVKDDGTLMTGSGGATPVEIFRTDGNELLLQFYGAPPKGLRREADQVAGTEHLVIENMEGYFPGAARAKFMETLADRLRRAKAFHDTDA